MSEAALKSKGVNERTAFHEAGHAFLVYSYRHLFGRIISCTIEDGKINGRMCDGHVMFRFVSQISARPKPVNLTDEQWQKVKILDDFLVHIYLAGYMAEAIWADKSGSATIQTAAVESPHLECGMDSTAAAKGEGSENQQLPSDILEARKILSFYVHESEIDAHIQKEFTQTGLLLLEGWTAVQAVAEALLEYRTLSGPTTDFIIQDALAQMADEKKLAIESEAW